MSVRGNGRAVFLDRDGTINEERNFVCTVKDFVLLPHAGRAIRILKEAGFLVIVISNQSGIARGFFSERALKRIHSKMERQLNACGAAIDALYYCPHHPTAGEKRFRRRCSCRKPRPGLFIRAIEEHRLNPRNCFAVGNAPRDIIPAQALGCRTILLSPEPYSSVIKKLGFKPNKKCLDLLEAAQWIAGRIRKRRSHLE